MKKNVMLSLIVALGLFAAGCEKPADKKPEGGMGGAPAQVEITPDDAPTATETPAETPPTETK